MSDHDSDVGIKIDVYAQMTLNMLTRMYNSMIKANTLMKEVESTIDSATKKVGDLGGKFNDFNTKGIDKASLAFKRLDELNLNRARSNLEKMIGTTNELSGRFNSLSTQKFNSGVITLSDSLERLISSSKKFTKISFNDFNTLGTINTAPIERFFFALNSVNASNVNALGNALKNISAGAKGLQSLNFEIDIPKNMQSQLTKTANTLKDFVDKISKFNLNGLSSFAKDIKSIPRAMQGMEKLNVSKIGQVFSTLTTQIQPFLVKLKEASAEIQNLAKVTTSIDRFGRVMKSAKEQTKQVGDEAERTRKKLSNMLSFGKVYAFYNQIRHFGSGFVNLLNQAVDFTEIENYFSRAMGNMRGEAMKFQTELADMFGLAMPSMMKAQATFKNMLSSLGGLTEEFSTQMSERLTKMAVDFASLYNVSIDSSMSKFQAAMSRQVRPIRSVSGYDITQNVLGTTLESIGIYDRTITKMNEMEKRLLIILTLQQQMARSSAMGDYARTINLVALYREVYRITS